MHSNGFFFFFFLVWFTVYALFCFCFWFWFSLSFFFRLESLWVMAIFLVASGSSGFRMDESSIAWHGYDVVVMPGMELWYGN